MVLAASCVASIPRARCVRRSARGFARQRWPAASLKERGLRPGRLRTRGRRETRAVTAASRVRAQASADSGRRGAGAGSRRGGDDRAVRKLRPRWAQGYVSDYDFIIVVGDEALAQDDAFWAGVANDEGAAELNARHFNQYPGFRRTCANATITTSVSPNVNSTM